jgi:tetraacyldisaccharide 4'-kinase
MSIVERLWYGDDASARVARAALAPVSWLYGVAVGARAWRFDHADGAIHPTALPVLSLGNLTVGGTGKTPVAAWAAATLQSRGARPAIVMRGYGADEPIVHARLNPAVPVIVDADRVRGATRAMQAGADCVLLDDGFQHRRIARVSDWVLVAAERWRNDLRLLPTGPLREPVGALARADILLVTRKSATLSAADRIGQRLLEQQPSLRVAVCHLAFDALVNARTQERRPVSWLSGRHIVAAAAVGDSAAFFAQLEATGAFVHARAYRDHHAFTPADVAELVAVADRCDGLVCTLKDAVKLGPLWPANAAPLWYVSQIAVIERGVAELDRALDAVLAARQAVTSTAG